MQPPTIQPFSPELICKDNFGICQTFIQNDEDIKSKTTRKQRATDAGKKRGKKRKMVNDSHKQELRKEQTRHASRLYRQRKKEQQKNLEEDVNQIEEQNERLHQNMAQLREELAQLQKENEELQGDLKKFNVSFSVFFF